MSVGAHDDKLCVQVFSLPQCRFNGRPLDQEKGRLRSAKASMKKMTNVRELKSIQSAPAVRPAQNRVLVLDRLSFGV